jgi:hypothetical protein
MKTNDEDRIQHLLRQALPPVDPASGPARDLWPAVLRRLDAQPAPPPGLGWVWFDWALLAGLAVFSVSFPASIPLLLYYL